MLWQNNILNDIFEKARNIKITGFFVFSLILFSINISCLIAAYYIPKTNIIGTGFGIFYDDIQDMNNFLVDNELPELSNNYQYYVSLNLKSNYLPFICDDSHSILYSIDFKLPLEREVSNVKYIVNLNTYSFFAEFSAFESFLRYLTVHPLVGVGFAETKMKIQTNTEQNEFLNGLGATQTVYDFDKSTILFNLGGGFDYRKNLSNFENSRLNLLISLNARYSMCLDVWRINESDWKFDGKTTVLPKYYAPGLSIELYISMEFQII